MTEGEWITWKAATERVEAAGYDVSILRDWAKSGIVETRSRMFVIDDEVKQDESLPKILWQVAESRDGFVEWESGTIYATVRQSTAPGRGGMSVKAHRIEFCAEQLDGLAPANGTESTSRNVGEEPKQRGGGPKLSKHWPFFVAELSVWIYEGGSFVGLTPNALCKIINDRLAERGIDEMPPQTAHATLQEALAALGKASLER